MNSYAKRTAFVLNANAKSVSDRLVDKLLKVVPVGDLFYSRTLRDAENYYRTILRRGYGQVFGGGGDGTIVNMINHLRILAKEEKLFRLPKVGVLKLGTGNALASVLGASVPAADAHHIVNGGSIKPQYIDMIECDDGKLAPFAGIGYDGQIINDYRDLKQRFDGTALRPAFNSLAGYFATGLFKTIPRTIGRVRPWIRIRANSDGFKMIHRNGIDEAVSVAKDSILFEGHSPMVSVGSITCVGCNFNMYPFATRQDGFIQLRVVSCGLFPLVANIRSIWQGTYRNPGLQDFLVKDISIECDQELPYQVAGDAYGYKKNLHFKVAKHPVMMAQLSEDRLSWRRPIRGFLPQST